MDHETAEEIKRHFNVVAEGLRSDIRLIIEGLVVTTDRLDRVEVKLDGLETRFDGLEVRFDGLEVRFDGLLSEFSGLKTMILPLISRTDH